MLSFFWDTLTQIFWIPKPTLTEENLPNQAGKVFIVTGGYAGVGKELSKILYGKNGTVYIAGRSQEKADTAIDEIKQAHPSSDGRLEFLKLDLADLSSIKASANDFLSREQRLDVLTNNAGVMMPAKDSKAAQGHDLQMCTNCLGPFLFTMALNPLLQKTAASSPAGTVRVTWAASMATLGAPKSGIDWDASKTPTVFSDVGRQYGQTKAGNVLLAKEYQSRYGRDGIVSNSWNPGNLRSELQRHQSTLFIFIGWILYPAVYGAYTELYAGWSEEAAKEEMKGAYFGPWGRPVMLRSDLDKSTSQTAFWEWCDKETEEYK